MTHLFILFLAMAVDRLVGDPDLLWRRAPHPVAMFGKAIELLERMFNRPGDPPALRKMKGAAAMVCLLASAWVVGMALMAGSSLLGPAGFVLEVFVVAVLLAQKSLGDHVAEVANRLRLDGLEGGRRAVSMIVGRDPETLDRAGVSRAAIESLAENFSDGIVAPVFWYALLGLPGLLAYKMLNTADSMIGHLSDRYRDFGWAAARLDDLANLPASRLSALMIALGALATGGRPAAFRALGSAWRDSGLHRSPNAGWPEAAMAGALGVALAGPRSYGGVIVAESYLHAAGRRDADTADIENGLRIFSMACTFLSISVLALALVFLLQV